MNKKGQYSSGAMPHESVVEYLLVRKKTLAKQALLNGMKVREGPNVSREGLITGLCDMTRLMSFSVRGKDTVLYMPQLLPKKALADIIAHRILDADMTLPEQHQLDAFSTYMHGNPFRKENAEILAEVLTSCGSRKLQRVGRPTPEETKQKEEMREKAEKCLQAEKLGTNCWTQRTWRHGRSAEPLQKQTRKSKRRKGPNLQVRSAQCRCT